MIWPNTLLRFYLKFHYKRMENFMRAPGDAQDRVLNHLIGSAKRTEWGHKHGFSQIRDYENFRKQLPVVEYDDLKPYIYRMMLGERNVLWPGKVKMFSKSSGTTSDKSKFIPVPWENLRDCHLRGGHDATSLYYHQRPDSRIFANGKGLVMGGSIAPFAEHPETIIGDVSALMLKNLPFYGHYFHRPGNEIALMNEWESKIEKMAHALIGENITNASGVPTWVLVLFRRILEITGKSNILEVFPNFEVYMHGGVSFEPYYEQFRVMLPSDSAKFFQAYNASEGFFASQMAFGEDDMLLLLNNSIFYEFIPMSELGSDHPRAYKIDEIETDVNYAMLISTTGGLWRYMLGDTVRFTSLYPHKIKITGRTKHFINAFGEEVMIENTDRAIVEACRICNAQVKEYTVAPVYFSDKGKGSHEWLIEFDIPPIDTEAFAEALDLKLQSINSDYEAKRYKSMALQRLQLKVLPPNSFYNWLKTKGKVGGQNKVPRLSNHRGYVDELLQFMNQ